MLRSTFWAVSIAILLASLTSNTNANTNTFAEFGDAGDTLGTEQSVGSGIDEITGMIDFPTADRLDLYQVSFDSGTTLQVASNFDSELLILDLAGFGVASDDASASGLDALVNLPAGSYLIGLGTNSTGYLDGTNELVLFNNNSTSIGDVTNFGPLTGSSDRGYGAQSGSYTISFTSATTAVPEPTSLLIFAGIGMGILTRRRRLTANVI